MSQLEGGALDGVLNPSITGFARLRDNSGYTTSIHPTPGTVYWLGYNVKYGPFVDKRVRQAFNWINDRKRLAELITKNISEPKSLPWPKASLAYEEAKDKTYNTPGGGKMVETTITRKQHTANKPVGFMDVEDVQAVEAMLCQVLKLTPRNAKGR